MDEAKDDEGAAVNDPIGWLLKRFGILLCCELVVFAIVAIMLMILSGCAATPETPDAQSWYPGVNNPSLTPQQQMELIQTYNNDWNAEREREQQIWQRLQVPPPVYVRPW